MTDIPQPLQQKLSDSESKALKAVLQRCSHVLEESRCITLANFQSAPDEAPQIDIEKQWDLVQGLTLLSSKPVVYVCNVDEDSAAEGNEMVREVKSYLHKEDDKVQCLPLCVVLEEEASGMDDSAEYLELAGVLQSSMERVIAASGQLLSLQCFYTVGQQEARSWRIRSGSTALEGARKIHSDFAEGFVRAEVIPSDAFIEYGGLQQVRKAGKCRQEGKEYVLQPGDIVTFHSSK